LVEKTEYLRQVTDRPYQTMLHSVYHAMNMNHIYMKFITSSSQVIRIKQTISRKKTLEEAEGTIKERQSRNTVNSRLKTERIQTKQITK
jgi:hypothetical protein